MTRRAVDSRRTDCLSRDHTFRVFTQAECEALAKRVFHLVSAPDAEVQIRDWTSTAGDFLRGDVHMMRDRRERSITLKVAFAGRHGEASTNQWDDAGLQRLVTDAEAGAREVRGATEPWELLGSQQYPTPPKHTFESVLAMTGEVRAALTQAALAATEAAGLIGLGDLAVSVGARAVMNTAGLSAYRNHTYAEFSLTARTPDGTASGWAWSGHEDWARVTPEAVVTRAIDLAQRSVHPVAVEPGRYAVILEPAAVAALLDLSWSAELADRGGTVFSGEQSGTNKIGRRMMDARLGMVSDPWDLLMPSSTVDDSGEPLTKVVWFDRGVLKALEYTRAYARAKAREPVVNPGRIRLVFDGPTQTLEEMIASTPRGIWVNRFDSVASMHSRTGLLTGTTRDGTFLIENGKVTKPIRNLRFTESPFFALNRLEAAGEAVRASRYVVAPRLKLRDFDFTSMSNAV